MSNPTLKRGLPSLRPELSLLSVHALLAWISCFGKRSSRLLGAATLLAFLLSGSSVAETDSSLESFQLQELAWISGNWRGEALGGEVDEIWSEPSGDTMTGVFRLVAGGETKVLEFLLITQEEERVVFRFKHFRTDYETWEKDAPLIFDLIRSEPGLAVFESSVQDDPKRLIYRLDGDGLTVTIEAVENGRLDSFQVPMKRR